MKQGLSNKPNITRECRHSRSGFTTPPGGGSLENLLEEDVFLPPEFLICQHNRNTANAAATAKGPQEHQQKLAMGPGFLGTCQKSCT